MRLSTASVARAGRGRLARRFRPIVVAAAGLVPLLTATACQPFTAHPATQRITVAAVPEIGNANLYLAQHNGYFAKEGLSVKIERYNSVSKEITALNGGSVDVIAADYGDMIFAESAQTNPIYRLLADGYDAAPGVIEILTMPGSRVSAPADLAGLKVPVPNIEQVNAQSGDPGTLALASAISVLQSDGVNLAQVSWDPMPQKQEINELVTGQVQAILVSGIGVYQAQQKGAVELIDACSGPTSGIPLNGFFASAAWLREGKNATAAKAFQQAIYAADAAATMPGPIQAILPAWIGPSMNAREADLVATGTYPLSTITPDVQRTADLMQSESMTKIGVNVDAMVVK